MKDSSPKDSVCSYCGWQKQDHTSDGRCYHYSDQDTDYFYKDRFFQPPTIDKESQKKLLIEMMKEDEKNGMYDHIPDIRKKVEQDLSGAKGIKEASASWREEKYDDTLFPDKRSAYITGYTNAYYSTRRSSTVEGYSRDIVEAAFIAGRSKTSWAQFKKDHGI